MVITKVTYSLQEMMPVYGAYCSSNTRSITVLIHKVCRPCTALHAAMCRMYAGAVQDVCRRCTECMLAAIHEVLRQQYTEYATPLLFCMRFLCFAFGRIYCIILLRMNPWNLF